jgi:hypothetical protein
MRPAAGRAGFGPVEAPSSGATCAGGKPQKPPRAAPSGHGSKYVLLAGYSAGIRRFCPG